MAIFLASVLTIAVIVYILSVRAKDLPEPEPVSPFEHLDERKASVYENLRDLQFEYRVGKLSDEDYQATKQDLQRELAGVLAEIDRVKTELGLAVEARAQTAAPSSNGAKAPENAGRECPHCGSKFRQTLKFCGECGKPMKVEV
jgi:hypothetical protein